MIIISCTFSRHAIPQVKVKTGRSLFHFQGVPENGSVVRWGKVPRHLWFYTGCVPVSGQLYWLSTDEETDKTWAVINGLVPGVIYEMRVIAKNGYDVDSLETSSPVRRVRIGVRRGKSTLMRHPLGMFLFT